MLNAVPWFMLNVVRVWVCGHSTVNTCLEITNCKIVIILRTCKIIIIIITLIIIIVNFGNKQK